MTSTAKIITVNIQDGSAVQVEDQNGKLPVDLTGAAQVRFTISNPEQVAAAIDALGEARKQTLGVAFMPMYVPTTQGAVVTELLDAKGEVIASDRSEVDAKNFPVSISTVFNTVVPRLVIWIGGRNFVIRKDSITTEAQAA